MTAPATEQLGEEEAARCKCYSRPVTPCCSTAPLAMTTAEAVPGVGILRVSLGNTKRKESRDSGKSLSIFSHASGTVPSAA